jgi:hypothetical protein
MFQLWSPTRVRIVHKCQWCMPLLTTAWWLVAQLAAWMGNYPIDVAFFDVCPFVHVCLLCLYFQSIIAMTTVILNTIVLAIAMYTTCLTLRPMMKLRADNETAALAGAPPPNPIATFAVQVRFTCNCITLILILCAHDVVHCMQIIQVEYAREMLFFIGDLFAWFHPILLVLCSRSVRMLLF